MVGLQVRRGARHRGRAAGRRGRPGRWPAGTNADTNCTGYAHGDAYSDGDVYEDAHAHANSHAHGDTDVYARARGRIVKRRQRGGRRRGVDRPFQMPGTSGNL